MSIAVFVKSYSGETLGESTHRGINRLCEVANEIGLVMLGNVDPYDDTVFNGLQMMVVVAELRQLIDLASGDEVEAAREILDLAPLVSSGRHSRMVFSGD